MGWWKSRLAGALCAEGDEPPGGEDGARAWAGLEQGEIGRALRALCASSVEIGAGRQGDPELGDEGLPHERRGCDDACIGGERGGRCDGLETLCNDLGIAHVMSPEEGFEGSPAREVHRLESGPATQEVAEDGGVFLLQPVQHVRERVLEGTGEAVGAPHVVADHTATVCDELGAGAQRGALRLERLELGAMGEPPCELEGGVRGGVFGPAGREGCAIPCQRQGLEREEDQKGILAQGGDQGACVACETDGHGLAVAARAQRGAPRVDGLGCVRALEACTWCGASRLEAPIMLGSSPVETNKGSKGFVGYLRHASSPRVCE